MKPFLKLVPLALAALPLAACSTPTPLTKTSALDAFKPIQNSAQAPCQMQMEVAQHNSAYDTLKTGKEVSYKAPCQVKPPVSASDPKATS